MKQCWLWLGSHRDIGVFITELPSPTIRKMEPDRHDLGNPPGNKIGPKKPIARLWPAGSVCTPYWSCLSK
jgi:hypothetical protein